MSELIRDLEIRGTASEIDVRGVAHDSRRVAPGDLFVTWRGARHDGRRHAPEAIERGAVAVLSEPPAPSESVVPWLVAEDPHALLAPLAARLYGRPDREL
ncbi:MAG: Mur ligase domain-containing protein, partial [Thermoanaerobaculia bacterium]|nr:Mur ligase domain-containing protein [Thermoanaerobaculia bacterium]